MKTFYDYFTEENDNTIPLLQFVLNDIYFCFRCTIASLFISKIFRMGGGRPYGFGCVVFVGFVPSIYISYEVSSKTKKSKTNFIYIHQYFTVTLV